jgi:hypothetical protein
MNWKVQHALVSFVIMLSLFHNANAKRKEKSNTINTNTKKQVPYYSLPNAFPDFYGPPSTFGSDGRTHGKPYPPKLVGNEDLHGYGDDKRQNKVGGWWGRRDTIAGNA